MKAHALVLALLVAGCSNNISRDQLYPEIYRAYCAQYARCGLAHSESACKTLYDGYLEYMETPTLYEASIEAGKIRYDGARARRCIDAMAATPCSGSVLAVASNEDCQGMFEGLVPVGGACGPRECVPSAYCTTEAGGAECPGTCVARVSEGVEAKSAAMCEFPLTLVDGRCAKRRKEGEACQGSSMCESLSCGGDLVCKTPGIKGEACSVTAPCGALLPCIDGVCRTPAGVGEACEKSLLLPCQVDLHCDQGTSGAGTCRELLTEGQACGEGTRCMPPLGCSAGKCTRPAGSGESCKELVCQPEYYCETNSQVCKDRLAEGQACSVSSECRIGTSCRGAKCTKATASSCP